MHSFSLYTLLATAMIMPAYSAPTPVSGNGLARRTPIELFAAPPADDSGSHLSTRSPIELFVVPPADEVLTVRTPIELLVTSEDGNVGKRGPANSCASIPADPSCTFSIIIPSDAGEGDFELDGRDYY